MKYLFLYLSPNYINDPEEIRKQYLCRFNIFLIYKSTSVLLIFKSLSAALPTVRFMDSKRLAAETPLLFKSVHFIDYLRLTVLLYIFQSTHALLYMTVSL